ncbi:MAG TPA: anti-sigma factor [Terrimicrobiaceae bacterium]|nr:anti-sigma factor [Terrimicrobiaceae bacterium]
MSPEEREELASLYALGLLECEDLAAFEKELARDPSLDALVVEFERAASQLAASLPRKRPPAALKDAVLGAVQAPSAAREPGFSLAVVLQGIPWAVAAGFAVCCAVLWFGRADLRGQYARLNEENRSLQVRIAGLDSERARLEARVEALESESKDLKIRVASSEAREPLKEFQGLTLAPQAGAAPGSEVSAVWDPKKQAGTLDLTKLPPTAPDKAYQVWLITPDSAQPLNVGVLGPASIGKRVAFRSPLPVSRVSAIAISLEPLRGSPVPTGPSGPVVYLGRM